MRSQTKTLPSEAAVALGRFWHELMLLSCVCECSDTNRPMWVNGGIEKMKLKHIQARALRLIKHSYFGPRIFFFCDFGQTSQSYGRSGETHSQRTNKMLTTRSRKVEESADFSIFRDQSLNMGTLTSNDDLLMTWSIYLEQMICHNMSACIINAGPFEWSC